MQGWKAAGVLGSDGLFLVACAFRFSTKNSAVSGDVSRVKRVSGSDEDFNWGLEGAT